MPMTRVPTAPPGMRFPDASSAARNSSGHPTTDLPTLLYFHYGTHIPIESPLFNAQGRIFSMITENDIENEAQRWEQYFEEDCHLVGAISGCYGHIKEFKVLVYELVSERKRAIAKVCRALASIPVGYQLPPTGQHGDQLLKAIDMAQRIQDLSIRYTKRVLRYHLKFPDGPAPTVAHICRKKYLEPISEVGGFDDSSRDPDKSDTSEDEESLTLESSDSGSEEESEPKAAEGRVLRSDLGKMNANITGQNPGKSQSTPLGLMQGRIQQPLSAAPPRNKATKDLPPCRIALGATHSDPSRPRFVLRALLKHRSPPEPPLAESEVQPMNPIKGKPFLRKRSATALPETVLETPGEVSFPIPCPYRKCGVTITSMDHAMSHWIRHPLGQFRCPACKNRIIKFAHSVKSHCISIHKLDPEAPEVLEQIELGYQRLTKLWREAVGLSTTGDYEVYTWEPPQV